MFIVHPIGCAVLLASFLCLTFKGIIIIKTRTFRNPFNRKQYVKNENAVLVGAVLIILGLLCFASIFFLLKQ